MNEKAGCRDKIRLVLLAFCFTLPFRVATGQRYRPSESWQQQEWERQEQHLDSSDDKREKLREDDDRRFDSLREGQQRMEVRVEGDERYVTGGAAVLGAMIGSGVLAWYLARVLGNRPKGV